MSIEKDDMTTYVGDDDADNPQKITDELPPIIGYLPTGTTGILSLVLLAIPLFMIAGSIMEKGRIAAPLAALAEMFIGHIKGGLNVASWCRTGKRQIIRKGNPQH